MERIVHSGNGGGKTMYFLALLLIIRTREPYSFSRALEEAEVPSSLFPATGQTPASQHGGETRVALIWHDHAHAHLRLSCLNMTRGTLKKTVQQAIAPGPVFQYAGQNCEVESVDLSNTRWAGTASWADMATGHIGTRMKFAFTTPLFTSPAGEHRDNALPFPHPLVLFTAAHQQWQSLNGPLLPYTGEQAVDLAECMVTEYHLETVKQVFHDERAIGYLGWIEYTCLRQEEAALATLNALARLTFFTGSGYRIERGMGVTTVTITK